VRKSWNDCGSAMEDKIPPPLLSNVVSLTCFEWVHMRSVEV